MSKWLKSIDTESIEKMNKVEVKSFLFDLKPGNIREIPKLGIKNINKILIEQNKSDEIVADCYKYCPDLIQENKINIFELSISNRILDQMIAADHCGYATLDKLLTIGVKNDNLPLLKRIILRGRDSDLQQLSKNKNWKVRLNVALTGNEKYLNILKNDKQFNVRETSKKMLDPNFDNDILI